MWPDEVPVLQRERSTALEQRGGLPGVAFGEVDICQSPGRPGQAEPVVERLGEANRLAAVGHSLRELSPLGETPGQPASADDDREPREAEALARQIAL